MFGMHGNGINTYRFNLSNKTSYQFFFIIREHAVKSPNSINDWKAHCSHHRTFFDSPRDHSSQRRSRCIGRALFWLCFRNHNLKKKYNHISRRPAVESASSAPEALDMYIQGECLHLCQLVSLHRLTEPIVLLSSSLICINPMPSLLHLPHCKAGRYCVPDRLPSFLKPAVPRCQAAYPLPPHFLNNPTLFLLSHEAQTHLRETSLNFNDRVSGEGSKVQ